MCGLCGDYDGNPNNDFTKPDGSQTDSSSQFGDSWQTDEDEDATSVTFTFLNCINHTTARAAFPKSIVKLKYIVDPLKTMELRST